MPINMDRLKEVIVEKIEKKVAEECVKYGGTVSVDIEVDLTSCEDDYIFAVSHARVPTSEYMHRYGMYCYSGLGFSLYYYDSNVIDVNKKISIDFVKEAAMGFFKYHSRKLGELLHHEKNT